jgi:hypothetical protein
MVIVDLSKGNIEVQYKENGIEVWKPLSIKGNSNCSFFEPFRIGIYEITLRLDWNSLDSNGFPILDVDFYNTVKDQKVRNKKFMQYHHTLMRDINKRSYEWRYRDKNKTFEIRIIWSVSINESCNAEDTCDAVVINKLE